MNKAVVVYPTITDKTSEILTGDIYAVGICPKKSISDMPAVDMIRNLIFDDEAET